MLIARRNLMIGNGDEEMYKEYYMSLVCGQQIGSLDVLVDDVTTLLSSDAFQVSNSSIMKPIRKIVFKNNISGGTRCFGGNQAIEELVFEKDVSLSTWSLQNCTGLKTFRVGGRVVRPGLGGYAFQGADAGLNVYTPNQTFSELSELVIPSYAPDTAVFHCSDGDYDKNGNPVVS